MSLVTSMPTRLLLLVAVLSIALFAQTPTGTITGTVTDATGAVVPNAKITITNKATDSERAALANSEGFFSAPALLPGDYLVKCEQAGFRTTIVSASVQAGGTTSADMQLQVGTAKEIVSVEASAAQVEYESHSVDGVITRAQIQGLPLNGRSFLNLASLEPGVSVNVGSTAQYNAQFSV